MGILRAACHIFGISVIGLGCMNVPAFADDQEVYEIVVVRNPPIMAEGGDRFRFLRCLTRGSKCSTLGVDRYTNGLLTSGDVSQLASGGYHTTEAQLPIGAYFVGPFGVGLVCAGQVFKYFIEQPKINVPKIALSTFATGMMSFILSLAGSVVVIDYFLPPKRVKHSLSPEAQRFFAEVLTSPYSPHLAPEAVAEVSRILNREK